MNRFRPLLVLVLAAMCGGCAGHTWSCPDSNHLDTWIGKTEEDLVRKKGEPTYRQTKFTRDNTVVVAWRTVRWDCPECNRLDAPADRCAYCAPDTIEEVERYFIRADTGIVYDWDWSGPWGEQYFSEADTLKAAQTAGRPESPPPGSPDSPGDRPKALEWSDFYSWAKPKPAAAAPKRTGRCIRY